MLLVVCELASCFYMQLFVAPSIENLPRLFDFTIFCAKKCFWILYKFFHCIRNIQFLTIKAFTITWMVIINGFKLQTLSWKKKWKIYFFFFIKTDKTEKRKASGFFYFIIQFISIWNTQDEIAGKMNRCNHIPSDAILKVKITRLLNGKFDELYCLTTWRN